MEEIKVRFGFSRAQHLDHFSIHEMLLSIFTPEWLMLFDIPQLIKPYQTLCMQEQALIFRRRDYDETPTLARLRTECNNNFRYILQIVRAQLHNPADDIKIAANRLFYLVRPFKNMPRVNNAEAMAGYSKFLLLMKDPEQFEYVKQLDLELTLENLAFLVEEFQRVSSQKAMAAYDRRTGNLRKVRRQVDAAFRELATVINALYCVNHYIERNAEKEKALAEVINQVNAVLRDASKTLVRKGLAYVPVSQRKEKTDSAESES
ncbi:hypothetical protein B5F77_03885 [Parabacteroides sp. An277]|uniref:DUF6261 family protein n=1 Tax=Parabacteroides sp. An277 TaxID=1965619 RepID=UPI000B38121E|nr:DUF6261 family protein [Parabacteroides sp. An277]OUO54335.1 hypothetical protein B5F77_03885 [Parabacteroides sp. An277]